MHHNAIFVIFFPYCEYVTDSSKCSANLCQMQTVPDLTSTGSFKASFPAQH